MLPVALMSVSSCGDQFRTEHGDSACGKGLPALIVIIVISYK